MKSSLTTAALSLMIAAGPMFVLAAQEPQTPPRIAPAQPPPVAQAPRPLPEGAMFAFIDLQRVAGQSVEGKAATAKVQALNQKKVTELNDKNKQLQAAQQKLQGGSLLNDDARAQLEKEVNRLQVEIQRFTQDAQTDVQDLQQDLQEEFQRKLFPVIQLIATEKKLQILFSRLDAGIVWAEPSLDITADVITRFDAVTGAAAAPKPPAQKPPPQ